MQIIFFSICMLFPYYDYDYVEKCYNNDLNQTPHSVFYYKLQATKKQ